MYNNNGALQASTGTLTSAAPGDKKDGDTAVNVDPDNTYEREQYMMVRPARRALASFKLAIALTTAIHSPDESQADRGPSAGQRTRAEGHRPRLSRRATGA